MSAPLPPIAVSCGDPAGIGPEIAQKAWAKIGRSTPFFIVGPAEPFRRFGQAQEIDSPADAQDATALPVLSRGFALGDVVPGTPNAAHSGVVKAAIETGDIDANRLKRWQKLVAEERFNAATMAERRAGEKSFQKMVNAVTRPPRK